MEDLQSYSSGSHNNYWAICSQSNWSYKLINLLPGLLSAQASYEYTPTSSLPRQQLPFTDSFIL